MNPLIDWSHIDDVLFDMDGTLLDLSWDSNFWLHILPSAIAEKRHIPLHDARQFAQAYKQKHCGTLRWYCLADWSMEVGLDVEQLHQSHVESITIIPGAERLVDTLRSMGKRVGIVTNADNCVLRQKQAIFPHFLSMFDFEVSTSELGQPKEHPACWDELDSWLVDRDMNPIDRSRAFFADDNESVLQSLHSAQYLKKNLLFMQRPELDEPIREASKEFPSVSTLESLLHKTS